MELKKTLIIVILTAFIISCGYKAPPKPPEKLAPEEIKEILIVKRPHKTLIKIKLPERYQEGKKIKAFKVKVERCNEKCKACTTIYNTWTESKELLVEDTPTVSDRCYKIKGKTKRNKKLKEKRIFVRSYKSMPSPNISVVEIKEDIIKLEISGCKNLPANIYKRTGKTRFTPFPQFTIRSKIFTDKKVIKGVQYCYLARCSEHFANEVSESAPSNEICVRPMDITPPPVPVNLSGIYHKGKVYLAWDPVKAKDLAGYVVYRFEYNVWVRLNSKPIPFPTFVDENPPKSGPLKYAVSSVDKFGNESKKSKPVVLRTR